MCIAIPMKIMEILPDNCGRVEFDGIQKKISLKLLPQAKAGDFVLIHAGYAIELIDRSRAELNLNYLDAMKELLEK